VLRFVLVERHFEHIIAADAHSVNLRFWLAVARRFGVLVGGVRLAHSGILSRLAQPSAPDSVSVGVGIPRTAIKHSF
jgi:hypothetical protein